MNTWSTADIKPKMRVILPDGEIWTIVRFEPIIYDCVPKYAFLDKDLSVFLCNLYVSQVVEYFNDCDAALLDYDKYVTIDDEQG